MGKEKVQSAPRTGKWGRLHTLLLLPWAVNRQSSDTMVGDDYDGWKTTTLYLFSLFFDLTAQCFTWPAAVYVVCVTVARELDCQEVVCTLYEVFVVIVCLSLDQCPVCSFFHSVDVFVWHDSPDGVIHVSGHHGVYRVLREVSLETKACKMKGGMIWVAVPSIRCDISRMGAQLFCKNAMQKGNKTRDDRCTVAAGDEADAHWSQTDG